VLETIIRMKRLLYILLSFLPAIAMAQDFRPVKAIQFRPVRPLSGFRPLQPLVRPPLNPFVPQVARITFRPTANDAAALARFDLRTIPPHLWRTMRYVWINTNDPEDAQATSLVVNQDSRASVIYRPSPVPVPFGMPPVLLLRIDARVYAPGEKNLREWLETWERLAFDPALNTLITRGMLKFILARFPDWRPPTAHVIADDLLGVRRRLAGQSSGLTAGEDFEWVERKVAPYRVPGDRQLYNTRWDKVPKRRKVEDIDVIRIADPGIDREALGELIAKTQSQAPLVTHPYFVFRATSTIQEDDPVYQTIWGGLYFEFSGAAKAEKGGTDLDAVFKQLGIGDGKAVTFRKLFDQLRSDQRSAVLHSEVTGNPRIVLEYPILAGELRSSRIAMLTFDLKAESKDIDKHGLFNLLNPQVEGIEMIFDKANRLHGYDTFKGEVETVKGKVQKLKDPFTRVREVPNTIASNRGIPAPYPPRLEASNGCIDCHETKPSFDGWQPLRNNALDLKRAGVHVIGDLSNKHDPFGDAADEVQRLYRANPEEVLGPARDSYSAAVLESIDYGGGWKKSTANSSDVVKYAAGKITAIRSGYWHTLLTTQAVLHEVGLDVAEKDAQAVFNELIRPDPRQAVVVSDGYVNAVLALENPIVGSLKAKLPISRSDFNLIESALRQRVRESVKRMVKR
jgi:hypothetical protein